MTCILNYGKIKVSKLKKVGVEWKRIKILYFINKIKERDGAMNPALILIVIILAIVLWFLLSFVFIPFGKFLYRIGKDTLDIMNEEFNDEKENENL